MRFSIDIRTDLSRIPPRFENNLKKARPILKNEIAKDCEPFVPFKTGTLARSVIPSIGTDDDQLVYNTPYASRVYYGRFRFRKVPHPQATSFWFEKAKAINLKKWINILKKLVGL